MSHPQKRRIALIAEWYLPRLGGTEIYLHDLAQELKEAGADVEIIIPFPGPEEIDGIIIHRLCDMQKPAGGYFFPPSLSAANGADTLYYLELLFRPRLKSPLKRLKSLLKSRHYDVMHVHLGNTPFAFAATNTCIRSKIPTIATFHSVLGKGEIPIAQALSAFMRCASWAKKLTLTAVSQRVVDMRAPMMGNAEFEILPHGIDPSWANAIHKKRLARPKTASNTLKFLAPLRLHARKRPQTLLTAMQALKAHLHPDQMVHLHIAGDGPLRDEMHKSIIDFGLSDCVTLCGKLPRDEVARLLTEVDMVLLPTHLESFGIAALEARMAGVPVLCMNDSAATDFLVPDHDSLMAKDDRDFTAALIKYSTDPDLRQHLQNACKTPLTGYARSDLTARCLALYEEAIAKQNQ